MNQAVQEFQQDLLYQYLQDFHLDPLVQLALCYLQHRVVPYLQTDLKDPLAQPVQLVLDFLVPLEYRGYLRVLCFLVDQENH